MYLSPLKSIKIHWAFCHHHETFPFLVLTVIAMFALAVLFYTHKSGKFLNLILPPKQNKIHRLGYHSEVFSTYF
uniref:Uncharacterized protein n=1 Tax=Cebus imitator TaxID=2715852 RepID=A0A2K5QS06_CEBIM